MSFQKFSMDNLEESERLIPCPYNSAHMVVQHRMSKHLIKCRRSHSSAGTKTCIFNSMHVFPVEDIDYHHQVCPDRILVERFMQAQENKDLKNYDCNSDSGLHSYASSQVTNDVDWDQEEDAPNGVLKARERASKSNVVLNIQHQTPSERKFRRQKEIERLNYLRKK